MPLSLIENLRDIPPYSAMMVAGFLASLALILLFSKHAGLDRENGVYIFTFGCLGALVGAKILYLLTVLPDIPGNVAEYGLVPAARAYLAGGFVFFGGLIGGIAVAYLCARAYGVSLLEYAGILAPATALTAGFGRIGCYLTGCCYGVPTESAWAVVYEHSDYAPAGVPLVPVQLCEAVFDFILCAALLILALRQDRRFCAKLDRHRAALPVYLISYSVLRFIIEFYRGDEARGIICGLSLSQWIAVAVVAATLAVIAKQRRVV